MPIHVEDRSLSLLYVEQVVRAPFMAMNPQRRCSIENSKPNVGKKGPLCNKETVVSERIVVVVATSTNFPKCRNDV